MTESFVAVLMGSDSDLSTVQHTLDTLDRLKIPWEVKITSAHRTPEDTRHFVKDAEQRGCAIFIAAAGLAAHLAGAVAALTVRPVIGIPMDSGPLGGQDALLSTVQMPVGLQPRFWRLATPSWNDACNKRGNPTLRTFATRIGRCRPN